MARTNGVSLSIDEIIQAGYQESLEQGNVDYIAYIIHQTGIQAEFSEKQQAKYKALQEKTKLLQSPGKLKPGDVSG